jgi:hypothetical protein
MKFIMKRIVFYIGILLLGLLQASYGSESYPGKWSEEKACAWYKEVGPIKGFNFLPSTAVNSTDMWQAMTFDAETMDRELALAHTAGYNSARVFLPFIVWEDDPEGFIQRMDQYLTIADKHGISTMFIFFDDCAFAGKLPYLGKQDDPRPGVHNSGWTPSPGPDMVNDPTKWASLRKYVKDIADTFKDDPRVLVWDVYNEPGNARMGKNSMPLVEATFKWLREVNPSQPLTVAPWGDFTNIFWENSQMTKTMFDLSDIITFHTYQIPAEVRRVVQVISTNYSRPIICTEWLRRQIGHTFETILPIFEEFQIGWYQWGMVAGRTQTYLHWRSQPGDPDPKIWQHDVYHTDGRPYDPKNSNWSERLTFKSNVPILATS